MLNSPEHEIFPAHIVGILSFISRKNSILGLYEPEKAEFLDSFILMSIWNFMLNWVEHENSLITSRPVLAA